MTISARGAVLIESGRTLPFADSRPLEIWDLELESPGPGEVLVRTTAAGVCHSDLSVVEGNRPRPLPMVLGHEGAGVVEALGEGVDDLVVGDVVVMVFLPRCGTCDRCTSGSGRLPCRAGSASNEGGTLLSGARRFTGHGSSVHHHLGVSAFSTHTVVDRRSLVKVGRDVPPAVAALLGCALITGGGAVLNEVDVNAVDSIAVVGLGGVGLSALIVARAAADVRLVAVDSIPEKRELAVKLGADAAYDPAELSRVPRAAAVIEAAGHPRAFETAVELTAPGGTTVTVGLPAPTARSSISPLALTAGARRIVGSYLGSSIPARDIPAFERMWRSGRLPIEELISDRLSLDDINTSMDRLADGTAVRQIIEFV